MPRPVTPADVTPVDIALVGGGMAGLAVLLALDAAVAAGAPRPDVVVVDPVHRSGVDRTWCRWHAGPDPLDPLLLRTWPALRVVGPDGAAHRLDLAPLRYTMLRSDAYYAAADAAARRLGARRVTAAADQVRDGAARASVRAGGTALAARWVLDSRPAPPRRPGRTALVQHFLGWTVRAERDAFDPELPTLMDFTVAQPPRGVAFAYCLPLDARRALVEHTVFSRARWPVADHERALRGWLAGRPGLGEVTVEATERGAIPMTDAPFVRRAGRRVARLGTAGGATRPSTGYTFAAAQRQAAALAAAWAAGRDLVPPAPYPRRHRWLDAVLLRAIDRGLVDGASLLTAVLTGNPPARALAVLDGTSGPAQELALMRTAPFGPMARAALGDGADRSLQRARHPLGRFGRDSR